MAESNSTKAENQAPAGQLTETIGPDAAASNEETKEWEEIYRITNRGGKGVKTLNVSEKTGRLVGFLAVDETDDLFITCVSGVTIRTHIKNIRSAGRATRRSRSGRP